MRYRCLKVAIFISIVWLTSSAAPSSAQMPTRATSPEFGGIEFENDMTPRRHAGENLSDHGLDFLAIIPKAAAAASPHHGPPH